MTKSANKLYKESKSDLSFKIWLKTEQEKGGLADHETMFGADGENEVVEVEVVKEKLTPKKAKNSLARWNMVGIASLGLVLFGLSQVGKLSKA